jgi:hypothetical protein
VGSELGGSQISTLLETLPGIANVLRSPVADALVNIMRAAARIGEFNVADAEELVRYATRRSLMAQDEADRVMADIHAAEQKRLDKAADRVKAQADREKVKAQADRAKASAKPTPKPAAHKPAPKAKAVVRPPAAKAASKPKAVKHAKPAPKKAKSGKRH